MNRAELIKAIARQSKSTKTPLSQKEVATVLNLIVSTIVLSVRCNEDVTISRFGRFEVRHHKAIQKRSPHDGQLYDVPAKRTIGFKPSYVIRNAVAE